MSARDERLAGQLPVWVWETLEERPPYAPGYAPARRKLSEDKAADMPRGFVRGHAREYPDEEPLDPELYHVQGGYVTPSPSVLDALHTVPVERIEDRLDRWDATARTLPVEAVPLFWQEKVEAVELFAGSRYVGPNRYGTLTMPRRLIERLRTRAAAARRTLDIVEQARQRAAARTSLPGDRSADAYARDVRPFIDGYQVESYNHLLAMALAARSGSSGVDPSGRLLPDRVNYYWKGDGKGELRNVSKEWAGLYRPPPKDPRFETYGQQLTETLRRIRRAVDYKEWPARPEAA